MGGDGRVYPPTTHLLAVPMASCIKIAVFSDAACWTGTIHVRGLGVCQYHLTKRTPSQKNPPTESVTPQKEGSTAPHEVHGPEVRSELRQSSRSSGVA